MFSLSYQRIKLLILLCCVGVELNFIRQTIGRRNRRLLLRIRPQLRQVLEQVMEAEPLLCDISRVRDAPQPCDRFGNLIVEECGMSAMTHKSEDYIHIYSASIISIRRDHKSI